jgi:spore maturation protein SpmA
MMILVLITASVWMLVSLLFFSVSAGERDYVPTLLFGTLLLASLVVFIQAIIALS